MAYRCAFCNSVLSSQANLLKHHKRAKFCLEIQGKEATKTFTCACGKNYTHVDSFNRHKKDCQQSTLDIKNILNKIEQLLQKSIDKPTNVVNNVANNIANNVALQNLEPLTDDDIKEHLNQLSLDFIQEGGKGFADFANSYPFKNRVVCTDKARKKLKYKNERGEIINDNHGLKLARRFFQNIAPRNEEIINNEYHILQQQVQQIADEEKASTSDITEILTKASRLQEILLLCTEAAAGKDNELVQEFVKHLSKMI